MAAFLLPEIPKLPLHSSLHPLALTVTSVFLVCDLTILPYFFQGFASRFLSEYLSYCHSCYDKTPGPKESCGGKGLLHLHFDGTLCYPRNVGQKLKQDRNTGTGADAEATWRDANYSLFLYCLFNLPFSSLSSAMRPL